MRELFSLNDALQKFNSVIIYGAGQAGHAVFLKLLQRNIKVECFADSHPGSCGTKIFGIPVRHIGELSNKTGSAVIVCGRYAFQVASRLEKIGFRNLFFDYGSEVDIIHIERGGAANG